MAGPTSLAMAGEMESDRLHIVGSGTLDQTVQYSEIQKQHELIKQDLARLRAAASPAPNAPPAASLRDVLLQDTARLHDSLCKHFDLEEDGGYLEPVLNKRPELSPKVARLQQQHGEILVALKRLEGRSQEEAPLEDLQAGVLRLLDFIAKHEEEETSLLQQTLLEDLGGRE